jgi:hypothetical protein
VSAAFRRYRIWARGGGGLLLASAGIAGACYAGVVAAAQIDYLRLKYLQANLPIGPAGVVAARAQARYPHNHNLSILMAERYWQARHGAAQRAHVLSEAERWCDLGLAQNPYSSALHVVKANLLAERDVSAAIVHWRAYVDWDYWNAYNHAFLGDLYCRAGRLEDAAAEVRLIQGTREHDWIARRLREALRAELQPPDGW